MIRSSEDPRRGNRAFWNLCGYLLAPVTFCAFALCAHRIEIERSHSFIAIAFGMAVVQGFATLVLIAQLRSPMHMGLHWLILRVVALVAVIVCAVPLGLCSYHVAIMISVLINGLLDAGLVITSR